MGKSKMIAKSCPKCQQQVAVATKVCKCGHSFFSARTRGSGIIERGGNGVSSGKCNTSGGSGGGDERRRTGRVRRARPHFYDSQDYQRQRRKPPKRRSVSQGSFDDEEVRRDESKDRSKDTATAARAARRRALKLRNATLNESRTVRTPQEPPMHPQTVQRCATLLMEINRKMAAVTWTAPDQI